ncbi:hypothetical protein M7I_1508 [Glarea lozoyensis 74030]|uniref:Uncharacterized protein n=1 Tax=Glarea lozoyensis (strain ATCC 74030 / MF5533) TaxID=1104152 RepID=H0EG97_GLAL7|nr:hypothetical protein M7I_1508 [Glarea lozoyensis 74030]
MGEKEQNIAHLRGEDEVVKIHKAASKVRIMNPKFHLSEPAITKTYPVNFLVPGIHRGPARTLGDANSNAGGSAQEDARRKAAEAAEARAKSAGKPKGKLGSQLQEQKRQTQTDTLKETSEATRRMRDADSAAETRAYN